MLKLSTSKFIKKVFTIGLYHFAVLYQKNIYPLSNQVRKFPSFVEEVVIIAYKVLIFDLKNISIWEILFRFGLNP